MSSDELLKKIPPHSIEAEQAILGIMLNSPAAVSTVLEFLKEDDFFDEKNKIIFKAIYELADKNIPADIITILNYLKDKNLDNVIGGTTYLSKLIDLAPALSNLQYYIKIIIDKSLLRALINASRSIIELVYEGQSDIENIADEAERMLFEVTNRKLRTNYVLLKDAVTRSLENIERYSKAKHIYTGLPTGYTEFDDMISGLQKATLNVIAARPAMGKTAFALNIATNVCRNSDKVVVIYSLEMSVEEVALRLISSESRIEMQRIRKGFIKKDEWDILVEAVGSLSRMKIIIDDTPQLTINELKAKSRRIKSKYGLDLIIIDYLQLISTGDAFKNNYNRTLEISYISRSLKGISKELEVPVIALSQLSRDCEKRPDKKPILADLRESGAIEQDADIVAFLFREYYYTKEESKKNIASLIVEKQRNGPTGTIDLTFLGEIVKFENLMKHGDTRRLEEEYKSYNIDEKEEF